MFVPKSVGLQDTDNVRDLTTASGIVTARVRALQAARSSRLDSRLGSPERSRILSHSSEARGYVNDGRWHDASPVSPTIRRSRNRIESSQRDARLPTDVRLHTSVPIHEGVDVYSRPLSRLPSHAFKISTLEQGDGTVELRTARSRLRPITERDETRADGRKEPDLTIDDLGSMLEDAIVQTTESPTSSVPQPPSRLEFDNSNLSPARLRSRSPPTHLRHHQNLAAEPSISPQLPSLGHDDPSQTESSTPDSSTTVTTEKDERQLVEMPSRTSVVTISDRPISRTNNFQRYNSQSRQKQPDSGHEHWTSIPAVSNPGVSRPLVSPVKSKTALWETLTHKPSLIDTMRASAPAQGDQRKGDWSYYQKSNEREPSRLGRRLPSHRRVISNPHSGSELIPLTLPRLVKRATSQHKTTSNSKTRSNSLDKEIRHSDEHDIDPVELLSEGTISPKSRGHSLGKEIAELSWSSHSRRTSQATVDEMLPELKLCRSIGRRPSKWDLLHRSSTASQRPTKISTQAEPERPEANRPSRPSIVESKIHELMAASKQPEETYRPIQFSIRDMGQVKQSSIVDHVADSANISTKHLSALQMPIAEQVKALQQDSFSSPQAPKTLAGRDNAYFAETRSKPIVSPVKVDQSTPTTPVRGRPKTFKQAFSQRGTPYAFEQRFSLSPSRSRSRRGASSVRVSVEVRDSPEKTRDGFDEHEVIVRANVEPSEVFDDSEE